jgi:hypothetical protein
MKNKKLILALYQIVAESILKWSDDYDDSDLDDAIDHINLIRNRNFEKGYKALEVIEYKKVDPRKLLPPSSFKGKPYGWLVYIPKKDWIQEFKKIYNRDISYILKMESEDGISLPIVIDDTLSDGYARVQLACALGEHVPVAYFKGIVDEE